MGKPKGSKANAMRLKKAGIPGLAPISSAKKHRVAGRFAAVTEDPRITALNQRCRTFGIPANADNRRIVSAQHMSCDLGMVMQRIAPDEVGALWQVWQAWCAAERAYRLRYIGQSETVCTTGMGMVPDAMEVDQSHTIDTRTQDERDRDAATTWMRWQGYLGMIPSASRAAVVQVRRNEGPEIWKDGDPTFAGRFAVTALRDLAAVVSG